LKSLAFLAAIGIVALAPTVRAADACSAAYEHAQERRADGDLIHAREQLLLCNKPECADFIRQDCGQWLGEVETALPSVSIEATDAEGRALTQVRVTVDGVLLAGELNGLALPLNPGTRHFRFEATGFPTLEHDVFLAEGQKSMVVHVKFAAPPAPTPTPPAAQKKRVGPTVYAFSALGAVGFAGFAVFGISGVNAEHTLRGESCAVTHTCTDAQTSPIEHKYLYADISLSVGVLSLGTAAYFLFANSEPAKPVSGANAAPRVAVSVGQSSVFAVVSGSY
jgi:hypothetical protein